MQRPNHILRRVVVCIAASPGMEIAYFVCVVFTSMGMDMRKGMEGREGKEGMGWIFVVRPHAHAALSLSSSVTLPRISVAHFIHALVILASQRLSLTSAFFFCLFVFGCVCD